MKIKRFNEGYNNYDRDEMWSNQPDIIKNDKISIEALRYIKELGYSKNVEPMNAIVEYLEESSLEYKDEDIRDIMEIKDLKDLKEYMKNRDKLNSLYQQIEDLKPSLNKSYTNGLNELFYTVQKDLLLKDFETFYSFFIEGNDVGDYDIHPDIYSEHLDTIADSMRLMKDAKKYNL